MLTDQSKAALRTALCWQPLVQPGLYITAFWGFVGLVHFVHGPSADRSFVDSFDRYMIPCGFLVSFVGIAVAALKSALVAVISIASGFCLLMLGLQQEGIVAVAVAVGCAVLYCIGFSFRRTQ